jgi:hypothetical protein
VEKQQQQKAFLKKKCSGKIEQHSASSRKSQKHRRRFGSRWLGWDNLTPAGTSEPSFFCCWLTGLVEQNTGGDLYV